MPTTRGDRGNKLDALCYEAFRTASFQRELGAIRTNYAIPDKGFPNEAAYTRWQVALYRYPDRERSFEKELAVLTRAYKLTPAANLLVREYVLFGKSPVRFMSETNFEPCDIEWPHMDTGPWSKSGVPFVKIVISDYASQEDVQRYVKGHWKAIQSIFDAHRGGKRRRIKPIADQLLVERIFQLSQMLKKELDSILLAADPAAVKLALPKAQKIRRIIKKETGKPITEDRIEQIIKRYRQARGS